MNASFSIFPCSVRVVKTSYVIVDFEVIRYIFAFLLFRRGAGGVRPEPPTFQTIDAVLSV
jgi:hypothetical protein